MRVYTALTTNDPAALEEFVRQAYAVEATGVTIFTRPHLVQTLTAETEKEIMEEIDAAAARKDYKGAATAQDRLDNLRTASREKGIEWIKNLWKPIEDVAQLVVLGNLQWDSTQPFTTQTFLANLGKISAALLSTGIGGVVQKTPLDQRVFIPTGATSTLAVVPPTGAAAAPTPAPSTRHPSLPAILSDKEAEFAAARLGLDRGGQRRTRNEAGNKVGYSPNIAAKVENAISRKWPQLQTMLNEETAATA